MLMPQAPGDEKSGLKIRKLTYIHSPVLVFTVIELMSLSKLGVLGK